ncbi:unnamed protein product [Sphenostylis stenocarpa]|uniref:Uncharacterized protein n=1 Tax=Sphenostylis stenocarpa TaxID=92480 RepID=A0AA86W146_9FABA|nr:unnamed protein product [Sphenostylis stenocarpa]
MGEEAFPFRQIDAYDLNRKWKWFWNLMEKMDPNTKRLGKDNTSYVFIYGGNDKLIQNLSNAIRDLEDEMMKNVNMNIENYQLGNDNPDDVPYFWMGINRKKQKESKNRVDSEVEVVVDTLLSFKEDKLGWVLLSDSHPYMVVLKVCLQQT